jgi:hypothetical protein
MRSPLACSTVRRHACAPAVAECPSCSHGDDVLVCVSATSSRSSHDVGACDGGCQGMSTPLPTSDVACGIGEHTPAVLQIGNWDDGVDDRRSADSTSVSGGGGGSAGAGAGTGVGGSAGSVAASAGKSHGGSAPFEECKEDRHVKISV